jgi:hypothetical protein
MELGRWLRRVALGWARAGRGQDTHREGCRGELGAGRLQRDLVPSRGRAADDGQGADAGNGCQDDDRDQRQPGSPGQRASEPTGAGGGNRSRGDGSRYS